MAYKGRWKSFTISDKINILVQVDAHIVKHILNWCHGWDFQHPH
jgi:hypothetical protein